MKSSFSPLSLDSLHSSKGSSKLDNPLAAFLGSLILLAVVTVHFYALGAKSDPAILAYDESASWQLIDSAQSPLLASASSVLFSVQDSSPKPGSSEMGTILSVQSGMPALSSRGFGMSTSPSTSTGLEATLLVLNFGQ
jgi:hypothetical protein